MTEWQIKKQWFKHNRNPLFYKIFVLIGFMKSPTLEWNKILYGVSKRRDNVD